MSRFYRVLCSKCSHPTLLFLGSPDVASQPIDGKLPHRCHTFEAVCEPCENQKAEALLVEADAAEVLKDAGVVPVNGPLAEEPEHEPKLRL